MDRVKTIHKIKQLHLTQMKRTSTFTKSFSAQTTPWMGEVGRRLEPKPNAQKMISKVLNPRLRIVGLVLLLMLLQSGSAFAANGLPAISVTTAPGGGQTYSLSIQVLLFMTALTMLPAAITMMTSFTRIIIVLAILRQALGMNQTPSNQILIGLTLFLTLFIMSPVFQKIYDDAVKPYLEDQTTTEAALQTASEPLKTFMLGQTRETDLSMFSQLSGKDTLKQPKDVSFFVLMPAFVTSELKTAFQIGFLLFIPFLIIDLVVASVLMAMGMMMLSPMMISLPFKIMLFVLVDGWSLTIGTLASSFYV